ncbi:MAG: hypothetical protein HYU71_03955 [Bacteroidetes bacterium]|nr:hypothetical protein [Bacteroidota bacterium]
MKIFLLLLVLFITSVGASQVVGVYGGKNFLSANYLGIQYVFPSNYPLFLSAKGLYESFNQNRLKYSSYGFAVQVHYALFHSNEPSSNWNVQIGAGPIIQRKQEHWLLPRTSVTSVGAVFGISGELPVSTVFSFSIFSEQRWFLPNTHLSQQFVLGVGLLYKLNLD